tara:strand:+ start:1338 stop:1571 length:234 start_codon:yes stop_codon:yes gene_type:complete
MNKNKPLARCEALDYVKTYNYEIWFYQDREDIQIVIVSIKKGDVKYNKNTISSMEYEKIKQGKSELGKYKLFNFREL